MGDLALTFGSVFVAEMGDKTQLIALTLAARMRLARLALALVLTVALLQTVSVTIGAAVARVLPADAIAVLAGLMFVAFGLWTWRIAARRRHPASPTADGRRGGGADVEPAESSAGLVGDGSLLAVGLAFFAAEVGDKTMFTTAGLAADRGSFEVWIGSFFAMIAALAIGVIVGRSMMRRIRPATMQMASAAVFVALGVATLVTAVL